MTLFVSALSILVVLYLFADGVATMRERAAAAVRAKTAADTAAAAHQRAIAELEELWRGRCADNYRKGRLDEASAVRAARREAGLKAGETRRKRAVIVVDGATQFADEVARAD